MAQHGRYTDGAESANAGALSSGTTEEDDEADVWEGVEPTATSDVSDSETEPVAVAGLCPHGTALRNGFTHPSTVTAASADVSTRSTSAIGADTEDDASTNQLRPRWVRFNVEGRRARAAGLSRRSGGRGGCVRLCGCVQDAHSQSHHLS